MEVLDGQLGKHAHPTPEGSSQERGFTLGLVACKSLVGNEFSLCPVEFKKLEPPVQGSLFHLPFLSFYETRCVEGSPGMYLLHVFSTRTG